MSKLLILNYHGIYNSSPNELEGDARLMAIDKEKFAGQMKLIQEHALCVVSLEKMCFDDSDDLRIALTFDDGFSSDVDFVAPILLAHKYPATFFRSVSQQIRNDPEGNALNKLLKDGFSIGSHGMNHQDVTRLKPLQQLEELKGSKKWFAEKFGIETTFFAAPYGRLSDGVLKIATEIGYTAVFSTRKEMNEGYPQSVVWHRFNITNETSNHEFDLLLNGVIKWRGIKKMKRLIGDFVPDNTTNKIRQMIRI